MSATKQYLHLLVQIGNYFCFFKMPHTTEQATFCETRVFIRYLKDAKTAKIHRQVTENQKVRAVKDSCTNVMMRSRVCPFAVNEYLVRNLMYKFEEKDNLNFSHFLRSFLKFHDEVFTKQKQKSNWSYVTSKDYIKKHKYQNTISKLKIHASFI